MNVILEEILKKMCEFNGLKFSDFTWKDDKHIKTKSKIENGEEMFIEWLSNYMRNLKISELRNIVGNPYYYYRGKKKCMGFSINFYSMYGFKVYEEDITEVRRKKLNQINSL